MTNDCARSRAFDGPDGDEPVGDGRGRPGAQNLQTRGRTYRELPRRVMDDEDQVESHPVEQLKLGLWLKDSEHPGS